MTAEHRTGKDIFDGAITAAYERAVYLLQEANDMQPMKGLLYSRLDTHHLQNGITIHIERRPGNPDALLQIVCPKDTNGAWGSGARYFFLIKKRKNSNPPPPAP